MTRKNEQRDGHEIKGKAERRTEDKVGERECDTEKGRETEQEEKRKGRRRCGHVPLCV